MNDRLRRTKKSASRNRTVRKIYHRSRATRRRSIGVFRSAAHDSEEARNGKELHRTPARGDRGQRVADMSAAAKHRIVDQIVGPIAAMVKRRSKAG
jgi:hypothetical protein